MKVSPIRLAGCQPHLPAARGVCDDPQVRKSVLETDGSVQSHAGLRGLRKVLVEVTINEHGDILELTPRQPAKQASTGIFKALWSLAANAAKHPGVSTAAVLALGHLAKPLTAGRNVAAVALKRAAVAGVKGAGKKAFNAGVGAAKSPPGMGFLAALLLWRNPDLARRQVANLVTGLAALGATLLASRAHRPR